jgi:hypothetical protein
MPAAGHSQADWMRRLEGALFRQALGARRRGAWPEPGPRSAPVARAVELEEPVAGWLWLACDARLEDFLGSAPESGLAGSLLRSLARESQAEGRGAWRWKALPSSWQAPSREADGIRRLWMGYDVLELRFWRLEGGAREAVQAW